MKKVLLLLIITILLAGIVIALFVRFGGGKYLKKAAKETYELGEDVERLENKIKDKFDKTEDSVKEKKVE